MDKDIEIRKFTGVFIDAFERETVVNMNDGEVEAEVFTYQKAIISRLLKNPYAKVLMKVVNKKGRLIGLKIKLPRTCICITNKPRKRF